MTVNAKPVVLKIGQIRYFKDDWEAIEKIAEVVPLESKSNEEFLQDLKGKYANITAIFHMPSIRVVGPFDKILIEALPESLKFICNYGAGYNYYDVEHLTRRGIKLSNTSGVVDASTADTHLYLILGALRNFAHAAHTLRQKEWKKGVQLAHDPEGKVLGIVGMGGIGRALRDRCKPLGFSKILYFNRHRLSEELEKDSIYVNSIEEILSQSDVVALNCPLSDETYHLINRETLSKAKDGIVITNTARGKVIDEAALVEALESGKVGAVGLDVYENEPSVHPGLLNNPRALLLPHMGVSTVECKIKMEKLVIENIHSAITKGELVTLIPEQRGIL